MTTEHVKLSQLSIYKSIDENRCGCDSEVAKAVAERGVIATTWRGHSEKYRPTEIAHDATIRMLTAIQSYDPVGDGNDSEASK